MTSTPDPLNERRAPETFSVADLMVWKFPFDGLRRIDINIIGPFDEEEMAIVDEFLELVKRRVHRSKSEPSPDPLNEPGESPT